MVNEKTKKKKRAGTMSDPDTMERYCSSYYDKHGLYNDGFPCPANKYCCQSPDGGGSKMCCAIQAKVSNTNDDADDADYSSENNKENSASTKSPSHSRTTISHLNNMLLEQKQLNPKFNQYKQSFLSKHGLSGDSDVFLNAPKSNAIADKSPQSSISGYSSFSLPFFFTK